MEKTITDTLGKYGIREVSVEYQTTSPTHGFGFIHEKLLTVKIHQKKFEELLEKAEKCEDWNKTYYDDMFVRERVPAVKKAYETYQMFLELARTEIKNGRSN